MNYVDTSLVVAALDSSDQKRKRDAETMLKAGRENVVSELFLVELASAISRKPALIEAVLDEGSKPSTVLLAYLAYLMSKFGLKLLAPSGDILATPLGLVGAETGSALGLAAGLRLRSLDLLHVANLMSLRERGYAIDSLSTSDREFSRADGFLKGRGVKLRVQGADG